MTSISKNVYIDELDGIVNEYNNTCNWTRTQNHLVLKRTLNQYSQLNTQLNIPRKNKDDLHPPKKTLKDGILFITERAVLEIIPRGKLKQQDNKHK